MKKLFYDTNYEIAVTIDTIIDDLAVGQEAMVVRNYKEVFDNKKGYNNTVISSLDDVDDVDWDIDVRGIITFIPDRIVNSLEEAEAEANNYTYCFTDTFGKEYYLFNDIDEDYVYLTGDYDGFDHNNIYWSLDGIEINEEQFNNNEVIIKLIKEELLGKYSDYYPISDCWNNDFKVEICYIDEEKNTWEISNEVTGDKVFVLNIIMDDYGYSRYIECTVSKNEGCINFSNITDTL